MFYILTFLRFELQVVDHNCQCLFGLFPFNDMSTGYQAIPQKVEFLTNLLCFLEDLDQKLDDL